MALRLVNAAVPTVAPAAVPTEPLKPATGETGFSSMRIPDVLVYDQTGKQLEFTSDLIKGKTVAINFIFTTCTTICPPLTATFRRVQQELNAKSFPSS